MALSLHTTKRYDVQYGHNAINGWDTVEKFLNFLRELQRDGDEDDCDEIYINEEETEVDIPFSLVERYKDHEVWGNAFTIIDDESDHNNEYAHLSIW